MKMRPYGTWFDRQVCDELGLGIVVAQSMHAGRVAIIRLSPAIKRLYACRIHGLRACIDVLDTERESDVAFINRHTSWCRNGELK